MPAAFASSFESRAEGAKASNVRADAARAWMIDRVRKARLHRFHRGGASTNGDARRHWRCLLRWRRRLHVHPLATRVAVEACAAYCSAALVVAVAAGVPVADCFFATL